MYTKEKHRIIAVYLITQIISVSAKITDEQYASMPTLFHLDNYDRCMMYGNQSLYCMIIYQLRPKNSENTTEIWKIIEDASSGYSSYRHDLLRHGVCISEILANLSADSYKDIAEVRVLLNKIYNEKYEHIGIDGDIIKMRCESQESPYSIDIYDWIFAGIVLAYATIIASASAYEELLQHKTVENEELTYFRKVISALSIRQNWNRLLNVDTSSQKVQDLSCIKAIRFYKMVWVITAHTVLCNMWLFVSNTQYLEKELGGIFIKIGDPMYPLQILFMISSWCLTYDFFTKVEKQEDIKVPHLLWIFIKKFFKLIPVMAFLIGFCSTWMVHLWRGPFWDDVVGGEYRRCRENWWTNLLYVNNYINEGRMCFIHGWYMAVNTQFYILGLLLLCLIWHYHKKIILFLGSIFIIHVALLFYIIYWNNYSYTLRFSPEYFYMDHILNSQEFHMVYGANFGNFSGLVAGIAYGYAFYKCKNRELFKTKKSIVLWWILTWAVILIVLGLPVLFTINAQQTPLFNAIYGCLRRGVFIAAAGMIVFGISQGQGWLMRWACKRTIIIILARLAYNAYLLHVVLQRLRQGIRRSPNYLEKSVFVFESVQDATMAFGGSFVLTLFIEMPLAELMKLLPGQEKKIN